MLETKLRKDLGRFPHAFFNFYFQFFHPKTVLLQEWFHLLLHWIAM